mgnify:CR=1 FL=1
MAMWDPFREFARVEREMRRMFDDFWGRGIRREALPGPRGAGVPATKEQRGLIGTLAVDLVDKGDTLVLRSEMPGLKKENINISVTENDISISGKVGRAKEEKAEDYYYSERAYSAWERTIPLPVKVKSEQVKAKYQDGVLEVTLPKTEEAKRVRKEIKIE